MNELDKILAVTKGQAAAGTDRIAFDPMALAHAIETGVAAKLAEERERCTRKAADIASACATVYRTEAEASACRHVAHELARALL